MGHQFRFALFGQHSCRNASFRFRHVHFLLSELGSIAAESSHVLLCLLFFCDVFCTYTTQRIIHHFTYVCLSFPCVHVLCWTLSVTSSPLIFRSAVLPLRLSAVHVGGEGLLFGTHILGMLTMFRSALDVPSTSIGAQDQRQPLPSATTTTFSSSINHTSSSSRGSSTDTRRNTNTASSSSGCCTTM